MPYITTVEQIGMERGIQEGLQAGLRHSLLDTLTVRFAEVPSSLVQTLGKINSAEQLKALHHTALTVETLAEFIRLVDAQQSDVH